MSPAHRIPPSGNPLIDRQHDQLSRLLQQAAAAACDVDGSAAFRAALDEFRRALTRHFTVEAVIISGAGYDAAAAHGRAHVQILRRLDDIIGMQAHLSAASDRHNIIGELEQTLLDHELLEDATYWDAIRAHSGNAHLKWSGLMVIGIDWVDDQHRRLVELFNQASSAARSDDSDACAALLRQCVDLARSHFADEERYLEARGVSSLRHRADHAHALTELDELAAEDGNAIGVLVDHYLRFWILEHILGIDRRDLLA